MIWRKEKVNTCKLSDYYALKEGEDYQRPLVRPSGQVKYMIYNYHPALMDNGAS